MANYVYIVKLTINAHGKTRTENAFSTPEKVVDYLKKHTSGFNMEVKIRGVTARWRESYFTHGEVPDRLLKDLYRDRALRLSRYGKARQHFITIEKYLVQ